MNLGVHRLLIIMKSLSLKKVEKVFEAFKDLNQNDEVFLQSLEKQSPDSEHGSVNEEPQEQSMNLQNGSKQGFTHENLESHC